MDWQRKLYGLILLITPPFFLKQVLRLAVFVRYLLYGSELRAELAKNKKLKNTANGKTACLLATGPSIRNQNLQMVSSFDCFSVSNVFLHKDLDAIDPKMHCFAPYHPPLVFDEYVDWMRQAHLALPPHTNIILGLQSKQMVDKYDLFRGRSVYYLALEKEMLSEKIDITKPVLSPYTSPLMLIPVLLYMGYERIILLGCDHNILRDYGKTVSNFYSKGRETRRNATSGRNWEAGVIRHLELARNVFRQYARYVEICQKNNVQLLNASHDSWLDFVKKVDFDSIFADSK